MAARPMFLNMKPQWACECYTQFRLLISVLTRFFSERHFTWLYKPVLIAYCPIFLYQRPKHKETIDIRTVRWIRRQGERRYHTGIIAPMEITVMFLFDLISQH